MSKVVSPYSREFGRAQRLSAHGRYEDALEVYDTLLETDPGFAAASAYRGQTLHWLGRFDDAADSLRRATELEPARFAWHTMLAAVECARGEFEAARDAAQTGLKLNPSNTLARAYDTLARGALGEWEPALDMLLGMDLPCQPDFQANAYILVEREIGRNPAGVSRTDSDEQQVVEPPKTALAHVPLVRGVVATCYLRRAERAANRERYRTALELGLRAYVLVPKRFGIDEFMAELYLLAQDVDHAESHWKRAKARRSDDDPIVLYLGGRLDLARNRPTAAVDTLRRTIELDRELEDAYYWLGRAYLAADDPVRAATTFREFARRDARYLHARLKLLHELITDADTDSADTIPSLS